MKGFVLSFNSVRGRARGTPHHFKVMQGSRVKLQLSCEADCLFVQGKHAGNGESFCVIVSLNSTCKKDVKGKQSNGIYSLSVHSQLSLSLTHTHTRTHARTHTHTHTPQSQPSS